MKILITLISICAIMSCQIIHFNVTNDCVLEYCGRETFMIFQIQNLSCPKSGKQQASLTLEDGTYYMNLIDQKTLHPVSIPLEEKSDYAITGVQFKDVNTTVSFGILNCSIKQAQELSPLCKDHQYVFGKFFKKGFIPQCGVGLDQHEDSISLNGLQN